MKSLRPRPGLARPGREVLVLYAGFLLTGFATVLLGPLIPALRAEWGADHPELASLFVAQFAASSVGAALSSLHLRRSLLAGYPLIAAGLAGLAHGERPLAWPAMALMGFGLGLVIPATNLVVALRNPGRRGAALSTLNLFWGLGAVGCPLLVAALEGRVGTAAGLWFLAVLAALAGLQLALETSAGRPPDTSPAGPSPAGRRHHLALAVLAVVLFLYVGVENAVGGWLIAYTGELGSRAGALLIGSGFWVALLAGRAATPGALGWLTEAGLYRGCLGLAACGTALLLLAGSPGGAAVGSVLTGLGLAPLFPLTVSLLAAQTEATRSREAGWTFAVAGLGGALLPWLAGQMAGPGGDLRQAFLVPLAALVLIGVLHTAHAALPPGRGC